MCMCDNNYLCFECECYLQDAVKDLIHKHKNDILDSQDWWWSIDNEYDVNIHCLDDEWEQPEAVYSINLYRLDDEGSSSYESKDQYDLEPMTRKEIRLL